jgi:hypothetical protein
MKEIHFMNTDKFETYTRKIIQNLGSDSIRFFTTIHDMEKFFRDSDDILKKSPMNLSEFEAAVQK